MEYGHARAVADGVNVDYLVYNIQTDITQKGSTIEKGFYVDKRSRRTRTVRWEQANDTIVYSGKQLDRDVVAKDQIRTVIRTFKEAVRTEIFPRRGDMPKTLIFAKDDSHADDIVEILLDEFGESNAFAQKITYRTTGRKPEELISEFRNNYYPRIAVTVDMISTGTDIKPLEILLFMRAVKSANFFEQMKGRGTRVIDDEEFRQVTPNVPEGKTHFVLVDAVGVYESAKTDEQPLEREPSVPLQKVLDDVALGKWRRRPELLSTLLSRLSRLDRRLQKPGMQNAAVTLQDLSDGKDLHTLILALDRAIDPDECLQEAQRASGEEDPSAVALSDAKIRLAREAVQPFDNPALRKALVEVQTRDEQVIDTVSKDSVIASGWDTQARESARQAVTSFREFMEANKDEITALQIIYSQPRGKRLSEKDLKALAEAIAAPPLGLTTDKLWQAYQTLQPDRVRKSTRRLLTDLVSLLRYTMIYDSDEEAMLTPYREIVEARFAAWLDEQEQRRGQPFDDEQRAWLQSMCDIIANSLSIERDDFKYKPFVQMGGLGRARTLFGNELPTIIAELNERLAA